MERLAHLRREYEETRRALAFPFNLEERERLKQRSEAILKEAKMLAETLNLSEIHWFSEHT
jgi:hypothetical protein